MTYRVVKTFRDRTCKLKLRKAGEPYVPPSKERADELLAKGFITAVGPPDPVESPEPKAQLAELEATTEPPADIKRVGGGWYELPNGERVRGKPEALAALRLLRGSDT